jgi:hypothetical protein
VSLLLAVIVMGAVEDEGTFWIQLLMIVILAAGAGIYVTIKSRAKRTERETHDEVIETIIETSKSPAKISALPPAAPAERRRIEWPAASEIKPRHKDLIGGMELLARNFLVGIVEQTDSSDRRDIEMRCLCFNELTRRGELWSIASNALKVYILDQDGFYGKVIRCEAMAELAGRTRPGEGAAEDTETTNEPVRSRTTDNPKNAAQISPA